MTTTLPAPQDFTYEKVYELSQVNWPTGMNAANGVPIGTTFTVNGPGETMIVTDDDNLLEDNNNPGGIGNPVQDSQSLDSTYQVLKNNFGLNPQATMSGRGNGRMSPTNMAMSAESIRFASANGTASRALSNTT